MSEQSERFWAEIGALVGRDDHISIPTASSHIINIDSDRSGDLVLRNRNGEISLSEVMRMKADLEELRQQVLQLEIRVSEQEFKDG